MENNLIKKLTQNKKSEIIITQDSKLLYNFFKIDLKIDLNDNSKRLDTEIVKLAYKFQQDNLEIFKSVKTFLNDNRDKIIACLKNKQQYKKIIRNYNIMNGAIDIIHLNQIVNELK